MFTFIPALDRYIFRLVIVPMIGVFVLAASLLTLDKMLRLFDFVASEGGPVDIVFKMLANLMPEYAGLAIPLGVLLGILLAFRKLAVSSELDTMRAVGLSYGRMLRMPYAIALTMMAVNLAVVGWLQPLSRYYYEELEFELTSGALGASIKVGEFVTIEDKTALRIERSEEEGRRLLGVFARVNSEEGDLSISAAEGRFLRLEENRNTIVLRLRDGQIIQEVEDASPRVLNFSLHDLPIDLPALERFRERGGDELEYVLPQLLEIGWSPTTDKQTRTEIQANFSYRLVEVVMMIFLPLLALSLAIPPKRSTSALGVFVAVVMVVAYHKVNEWGWGIAALGRVDPLVALWLPCVIFAALICWMYYRTAFVPGAQAIDGLEAVFAKLVKWIKSKFRRRRRSEAMTRHDAIAAEQEETGHAA